MNVLTLNTSKGFNITTWSVVAGTVIALSTEVTLNFLGIGLGLSSVDMNADSLLKAGMGSIIWLILSGIISMAIGGWVAGKISRTSCSKSRAMHGLLAWSFATLITILGTMTTASAVIGGPANIVKSSVSEMRPKEMNTMVKNVTSAEDAAAPADDSAASEKIAQAKDNLGKVSIAMFIAFLLSAIAGAACAVWGRADEDGSMHST